MLSAFLFFVFVACVASTNDGGARNLSIVTWNVNGIRKFNHRPAELNFLRGHDIVLLQETFSRDNSELLELRGFYSHHARALPRPGSRNVWGLSLFFRVDAFSDGFWVKIFSPVEWLLISRWKTSSVTGVTVINVYIPAHTSGFSATDLAIMQQTIEDLLSNSPGDMFVIGGDFNYDRFKPDDGVRGLQK
ncbi:MAG: endonuclease/exonuclease/phosphatase family protein [Algoriphagus sp.]|jgi:exonuclease III|nr:endonuclease/exonuclease/phosphatase family protein [Algoriphagus sp.]